MELDIKGDHGDPAPPSPFLLVDRIVECEPGKSAKGIKCVSMNEPLLPGHFPRSAHHAGCSSWRPWFQTGAVAALSLPENRGKLAVFGGVKNCRFKKPVTPGDVLELSCELVEQRGPIGYGKAVARVGGKIAAQAELTFVIQ